LLTKGLSIYTLLLATPIAVHTHCRSYRASNTNSAPLCWEWVS